MAAACIFCKIIKGTMTSVPETPLPWLIPLDTTGEIPSMKLFESDKVFAFLDINPLSYGHAVSFSTLLSSCLSSNQLLPARHPQIPRRKTPRYPRRPTH
jgi:hypothetical protein